MRPAALLLVALAGSSGVRAEPGKVEDVIPQGLMQMTREAFLYAFQIAPGDPYDPQRVRTQFKALWNLRLFEDITIDAEEGPGGGTVLIVKVKERPVLASIDYEENTVVTRTAIEDAYKAAHLVLQVGKPLDLGTVYAAESTIRDLLGQKGFLDARVAAEVSKVTETSRALNFSIDPGGKTRIRHIDFRGNTVFKDRALKGALKLTRERRPYWPWSAKNLYHPVKWEQDVAGARDLYLNVGYLDVEFRPPVVEVRQSESDKRKAERQQAEAERWAAEARAKTEEREAAQAAQAGGGTPTLTPEQAAKEAKRLAREEERARNKARKARAAKGKRWIHLTVDLDEGRQYRLGDVTVEGNQVLDAELLRAQIQLLPGQVVNESRLELGIRRITSLYEDRGYLYANVVRRLERREEPIADVRVTIEEDRPYHVARILFRGNSATQDRVLRRELLLSEGALFSRSLLNASVSKVNQLGYWQITEAPEIEPVAGENRVRITLPGQEQGRNEIQIGGGYSGLDGAFFNGVYSTRNFLGRGQVVSAQVQIGGRSTRYQLSFQEPWFLGRPYLFGASLFRREQDYGSSLQSESNGGGIVLGKRVGRNSRLNVGYNYENVKSSSFTFDTDIVETNLRVSYLTPAFSYSTINNPYRPSRGTELTLSVQIAGGPLGGDTSYLKPVVNYLRYQRTRGRPFFAFHAQAGLLREFGEDNLAVSASDVEGVPRYQRFWVGGDTLGPRVFDTRTITPRRYMRVVNGAIVDVVGDPTGLPPDGFITSGGVPVPVEVGGDRMYLLQTELVYPLNEQAEVAVFVDAGDSLFEDTSIDFSTTRVSTGVELRFHLPIFPVPLRLIWGIPLRELQDDRTERFAFSIGRSF